MLTAFGWQKGAGCLQGRPTVPAEFGSRRDLDATTRTGVCQLSPTVLAEFLPLGILKSTARTAHAASLQPSPRFWQECGKREGGEALSPALPRCSVPGHPA